MSFTERISLSSMLSSWSLSTRGMSQGRVCAGPVSENSNYISMYASATYKNHFFTVQRPCGPQSISVTQPYTFRKASFCSRCLLIMGVTWSVSELGPSLSAPPHQSSSLLYSCSRLSRTLQTCGQRSRLRNHLAPAV